MIKCNHCGAKNLDNAKTCVVCGKEISSKERFIDTNAKNPWYGSTWFIILMIFCFWPVGLYLIWKYKPEWVSSTWFTVLWLICFPPVGFYLMWKNKKFSLIVRIIITVALSAFWIYFIWYGATHSAETTTYNSSTIDKYTMKVSGTTTEKLGGMEFKVPKYFDVRVTKDEVYDVYFYPEREDAQSTLGFTLMKEEYNSEQVKLSKDNIINNWNKTFANLNVEEEDRNGNYILKATGSRDGAKMKAASIVNNGMNKMVSIILSVDDTDTTGLNYFGDFDNMIQNINFFNNDNVKSIANNRIDYYSAETFESDLNAGKNLEGKKVLILCKELHPDSVLGYNIYAGKHINLVSKKNPGIKEGEEVLIETKKITKILGESWKVEYELLDKSHYDLSGIKEDKKIKTIESSKSNNNVVTDLNDEIDEAKNQLHDEIDNAAESLKDEMGLAGKLFGGYIDEYKDAYKDAVNEVGDAYKDAMNEYSNTYDDIMKSFGY